MTARPSDVQPLAACRGVSVVYGSGATQTRALDDVDLEIESGESVAGRRTYRDVPLATGAPWAHQDRQASPSS